MTSRLSELREQAREAAYQTGDDLFGGRVQRDLHIADAVSGVWEAAIIALIKSDECAEVIAACLRNAKYIGLVDFDPLADRVQFALVAYLTESV